MATVDDLINDAVRRMDSSITHTRVSRIDTSNPT